jgi:hypothetical protein
MKDKALLKVKAIDTKTFHALYMEERHCVVCYDPEDKLIAGYPIVLAQYDDKGEYPIGGYALVLVKNKYVGEAFKEGYCVLELTLSSDSFFFNQTPDTIEETIDNWLEQVKAKEPYRIVFGI